MHLQLIRYKQDMASVQGILTADKFIAYTLERAWLNNQPSVSCIPAGNYRVSPWRRPNGDNVFILRGKSVCALPAELDDEKTRCLILFHKGNTCQDIMGCISPGLTTGPNTVGRSGDAMNALHKQLKPYLSMNKSVGLTISQLY